MFTLLSESMIKRIEVSLFFLLNAGVVKECLVRLPGVSLILT